MKIENAKIATNRYNKKAYNQLALRFRKDDPVLDLLDVACATKSVTKNEYVRSSLMAQYERDGITEAMIPEEMERFEKHEVNDYVVLKLSPDKKYKVKVVLSKSNGTLTATLILSGRIYTRSEQVCDLDEGRYFNLIRPIGENYNTHLIFELLATDGSADKLSLALNGSNIRKLRICCDNVFEQE